LGSERPAARAAVVDDGRRAPVERQTGPEPAEGHADHADRCWCCRGSHTARRRAGRRRAEECLGSKTTLVRVVLTKNPKSQIPNPNEVRRICDLGFGIWVLRFEAAYFATATAFS